MSKIYIINNAKEKELFSWRKVYLSARRVGASKALAQDIASAIEKKAYSGMPTREIFQRIKDILSKELPQAGIRFNLRRGIRDLGPSGFAFERFAGEIFKHRGYFLTYNQFIKGACIRHEIDFLAAAKKQLILAECKYHKLPGNRVDTKVIEYNYAVFLDLQNGAFIKKQKKDVVISSLIVTNTKFTSRAIKYAQCIKMPLLGWKYPKGKGLEYWIESQKLYPVTILPSFKNSLIEVFMREKMMLAKNLLDIDSFQFARRTGIDRKKIVVLIEEAEILLK